MKKTLTRLGEHLFSGANLIALGAMVFYHALFQVINRGLSYLHGQVSWLTAKSWLEGAFQRMLDLSNSLFSLYGNMCRFGIGMVGVLFVVSQLVNYKKKNISLTSFLIMFIISALLWYWFFTQIPTFTVS